MPCVGIEMSFFASESQPALDDWFPYRSAAKFWRGVFRRFLIIERWLVVGLVVAQRLWRCPNTKPTSGERFVFSGIHESLPRLPRCDLRRSMITKSADAKSRNFPQGHISREFCYFGKRLLNKDRHSEQKYLSFWPSKREALTQCWADAGPSSTTLDQHQPNIGPTPRVTVTVSHHAVFRRSRSVVETTPANDRMHLAG